ncbi:MAG: nucleotide pyrophosphohydrolase [Gammaproteobacteria bacterium]|nr:nucleotide pyrophosphohydrolase [Gammaproteobacteria bacterium]
MNELKSVQNEVDDWIKKFGYFDEMTNLSNLTEEVGEVARLIGREYGQQSFKKGTKPANVKEAIADELTDVLFIVVCLANQMDIDLGESFNKNMEKKRNRDNTRHLENEKLKN